MQKLNKKGQSAGAIVGLALVGIAFVVLAITLGIGGSILGDIRTGQTANSVEYNASTQGLIAIEEFSSWMDTLALVIVAGVIILALFTYLSLRQR